MEVTNKQGSKSSLYASVADTFVSQGQLEGNIRAGPFFVEPLDLPKKKKNPLSECLGKKGEIVTIHSLLLSISVLRREVGKLRIFATISLKVGYKCFSELKRIILLLSTFCKHYCQLREATHLWLFKVTRVTSPRSIVFILVATFAFGDDIVPLALLREDGVHSTRRSWEGKERH